MNSIATTHSSDTCRSRHHERNESTRNGRLRRRRRWNHRGSFAIATVALCGNPEVLNKTECEAFILNPSRTGYLELTFYQQKTSFLSTKQKRTRTSTMNSGDIFNSNLQLTPRAAMRGAQGDIKGTKSQTSPTGDNQRNIDEDMVKKWRQNKDRGNSNSTVYEDLDLLERAIQLEHKESKLEHSILKEKIQFIDQSKRYLVPDAFRFLIFPLFYSYGLFRLLSSGKKGPLSVVGESMTKAADFHFWIFVVGSPLLLNAAKAIAKWRTVTPKRDSMPEELVKVDPVLFSQILKPLYDWEDPKENCDDPVTFLVEYWSSVVNGVALLFAVKTCAKGLLGISLFQSNLSLLWLSFVQLVTRLGAVVSLYQFPDKLYDLERSVFTPPVGLFPTLMLKMVRWMMALAPIGLVCDFSKILLHLPKGWVFPLYASIVVALWGTWARMNESLSSDNRKDPFESAVLKPAKPLAKLFYGFAFLALWRKQLKLEQWKHLAQLPLEVLCQKFTIFGNAVSPFSPVSLWKALGLGYMVLLPLLGPLIHLKAFSKLFTVEYSNDLPFISTKEAYESAIEKRPERAYDMAWRHHIRWRKPRRLMVSKEWIYHKIVYWYFIEGTVWDREHNDRKKQIERETRNNMPTFERKYEEEMKYVPKGKFLNGGRENWSQRAHDTLSIIHEKNYVTKKLEDPLGVAVYKGFGVALGFNFDHTTELKEGEEPSPRRLQARAAKSAMRRYRELNDAEDALISKIETLEDPMEKEHYQNLLDTTEKENEEEIKYIASRLRELVPTTDTNGDYQNSVPKRYSMQAQYQKSEPKFRKVSENEMEAFYDDPIGYDGKLGDKYFV